MCIRLGYRKKSTHFAQSSNRRTVVRYELKSPKTNSCPRVVQFNLKRVQNTSVKIGCKLFLHWYVSYDAKKR